MSVRQRTSLQLEVANKLRDLVGTCAYNANLYSSLKSFATDSGLVSLSKFFNEASRTSAKNAEVLGNHLIKSGFILNYPSVDEVVVDVKEDYDGADLLEIALDTETKMTDTINDIAQMCLEKKDHITYGLMSKFLQVQVNCERNKRVRLDIFKSSDDDIVADNQIGSIN